MPVDLFFHVPNQALTATAIAAAGKFDLPTDFPADTQFQAVCEASEPLPGGLAFLDRVNIAKLHPELSVCAGVLCRPSDQQELADRSVRIIAVDNPRACFQDAMTVLFAGSLGNSTVFEDEDAVRVLSNGARVALSARLEDDVVIGPNSLIGDDVVVGQGTVIGANSVISRRCKIGRGCDIGDQASVQYALIGDHVVLAPGVRIGQEGFGFVPREDGLKKLPQLGRVILQDHVELGANTTVDRGTLGDTSIGAGTKIDNLVQIAHNVKIGVSTVIAAHAGLSGSCTVGNFCMLGGRVGLADQVNIGDGAMVAAASGVMHDIPAGERWGGSPAQPIHHVFRQLATLRKLSASSKKQNKQ